MTSILIIGYGNTLRSDDGVGFLLAEHIAQQKWNKVQALPVHQLTPELAEDIAKARAVIFVDAIATQETKVKIRELQPSSLGINIGHSAQPNQLLGLTEAIYARVPPSWWVLIPGSNFEMGEQLSAITRRGFADGLEQIKSLILSLELSESFGTIA